MKLIVRFGQTLLNFQHLDQHHNKVVILTILWRKTQTTKIYTQMTMNQAQVELAVIASILMYHRDDDDHQRVDLAGFPLTVLLRRRHHHN